jgi:transglutaminase-like putative cysteine protease
MKQRADRWWNSFAVFCLFAAFLVTTFRIETTGWAKDLYILKWLSSIGFLLGMAFGFSYFSPLKTRIMILLYSIICVPWALTVTTDNTLSWANRALSIANRFGITLGKFFNNTPLNDPILFVSFFAVLIWVIALWGGFSIIRSGRPWIPLLLCSVTMFTVEFYYTQEKNIYSFIFTVLALMVLSLTNFMKSSKKWQKSGTLVEFETAANIGRTAFVVSLVLVFLAWNITGLVVAYQSGTIEKQPLVGLFETVRKQISRITAPLHGPLLIQQDFYGDSIGLGTGATLGSELVFNVSVDKFRPQGTRYYWRARTYDTYENNLWKSTIANEIPVTANEDTLTYDDISGSFERVFTFDTDINMGLLYTPMYPTKMNRDATAVAALHSQNKIDLSAMTLESSIFAGENYQITANITTPTIYEMKLASTVYPKWILETYLQLPEDFSPRIQELALQLTENETTVYDKVQAVTLYLRNEIEYKETIPQPPKNIDPIEWFLFDLKQGFCNYYATAEVLLLRSSGIPARIVYGYAQGESDEENNIYRVVRRQAHAWPEVYFPGLGWVEFEPTSAQPIITRMAGIISTSNESDPLEESFDRELLDNPLSHVPPDIIRDVDLPPETEQSFSLINLLPVLWIVGLADLILLYIVRRRRIGIALSPPVILETFMTKRGWKIPKWLKTWSYYLKLEPAQKAFASIAFSNSLLGGQTKVGITPAEIVKEFSELLPGEKENAEEMLIEYHKILFSRYPGDLALIKANSKKIIRAALSKRIQTFFSKKQGEVYQ